jgi:hypothetical protein
MERLGHQRLCYFVQRPEDLGRDRRYIPQSVGAKSTKADLNPAPNVRVRSMVAEATARRQRPLFRNARPRADRRLSANSSHKPNGRFQRGPARKRTGGNPPSSLKSQVPIVRHRSLAKRRGELREAHAGIRVICFASWRLQGDQRFSEYGEQPCRVR